MSDEYRPCNLVTRSAIALAILMCPLQSAMAREPVSLAWIIEPLEDIVPREISVTDGEYLVKQRLLPIGLATLDGDVQLPAGSRIVVRAQTQLVRVLTQNGKLFCALESLLKSKDGSLQPNKSLLVLCLHDSDSNGRLDQAFEVLGSKSGVIMQGRLPKKPKLIDMGYREIPVTQFKGDYWVGVRYEQYFNIYGNRMLMTDFGGRGETQSLTAFDTFKSKGTYPRETGVLGGRFTILAAEPTSIRVRIEKSLPLQPFSVATTTTVRFY